jgi:hypothetical protein
MSMAQDHPVLWGYLWQFVFACGFIVLMGSEWVASNLVQHLQREGKSKEARERTQKLPNDLVSSTMKICLGPTSSTGLEKASRDFEAATLADPDPENRYWDANVMASCGKNQIAIRLLRSAIDGHYCAYEALQSDPLIAPLRGMPEYQELLATAKKCQDAFLAERAQASP